MWSKMGMWWSLRSKKIMIKKILIIIGITLVLIVVGIWVSIYLFGKSMCGDDPIGKYLSPDTKYEVVYYVRDCGATTGFVDNVEIDNTLIFRGEAKNGTYPTLKVIWTDDNTVSILVASSTTDLRIFREPKVHYRDINIQYDRKIIESYQKWKMRAQ